MERLNLEKFQDKKLANIINITGQGFGTRWVSHDDLEMGSDVCCDEDGDGKVSSGDTIEFSDGLMTRID